MASPCSTTESVAPGTLQISDNVSAISCWILQLDSAGTTIAEESPDSCMATLRLNLHVTRSGSSGHQA